MARTKIGDTVSAMLNTGPTVKGTVTRTTIDTPSGDTLYEIQGTFGDGWPFTIYRRAANLILIQEA